jgi:tRNA-dihydrouridine synthase B
VRTARKHIGWYTRGLSGASTFRHRMNTLDTTREQLLAVNEFFDTQKALSDRLVYVDDAADPEAGAEEPSCDGQNNTDRLAA